MSLPFEIYPGFVPQDQIEKIIAETYTFKNTFYNEENLARHAAYLSDKHPNRQSHAYATSLYYNGELPFIDLFNVRLEGLVQLHTRVTEVLGLSNRARTLFNVQEYFAASERVPKHNDGELLEFSADAEGNLDIKRSIRPERVAVLTLVNDTDGQVGTRLYPTNGDPDFVVTAKAGDLLIFDNINNFHGVDPLTGTVKREDGLLRLIIGWRSLNEKTYYWAKPQWNTVADLLGRDPLVPRCDQLTPELAESITLDWYKNEWPTQWAKITNSLQKAAF